MTEQIYINGVLMDSSEGKSVSLVFQSPFFTEIDSIVSNRTTSVELPKTVNNLKAIELANLPSGSSLFEYRKHKVVYRRDGVQVFSGRGTLLSITDSALKFSFVWGNVSAFKTLLDARLRELGTGSDHVSYNDSSISGIPYYPAPWNTKAAWGGNSVQPIMPVANIIKRISDRYGIHFRFPNWKNVFENYYIPLIYRNADSASRKRQGLTIEGSATRDITTAMRIDSAMTIYSSRRLLAGVTKELGLVADNGVIDVSNVDNLGITIPAGFAYKIPSSLKKTSSFRVFAVDENGEGGSVLYKIPNTALSSPSADGTITRTVQKDTTIVVNVSQYSFVALILCTTQEINHAVTPEATVTNSRDILIYDNDLEQLSYGGNSIFPLYENLPDWTVSQFIKNLMKIEGLFAYAAGDNEINFVTIGDLYSNRARAKDWTMKLSNKGDAPTEKQATFNNLAQRNWMRWAEDETVKGNFDSPILVKSDTLEEENDLVTLDFAPSNSTINVWRKNDDGAFEFVEVEPRILHKKNDVITFKGLDWETLIRSKYYNYQNAVEYPHTIKASAVLDTVDLLTLDLSVPIYARQWGHYYAITKMTTKDNGLADVELLRLGRAKVWATSTEGEENYDGGPELVVERVPDGYAVTMRGVSENKIQEYIESEDYHLALFRYGYARRGKSGRKKDRIHGTIGTHTARNKQFRSFRRRLRYRIIGHDVLKARSIKGQTAMVPIYEDATLIFELHEPITLPLMVNRTRRTKSGRLSNPAASGLGELYVGLIKRYEEDDEDFYDMRSYGWICVSNMVQVRGYNEAHTQYWEFEKSNIR